jgi:hypothetical protein
MAGEAAQASDSDSASPTGCPVLLTLTSFPQPLKATATSAKGAMSIAAISYSFEMVRSNALKESNPSASAGPPDYPA